MSTTAEKQGNIIFISRDNGGAAMQAQFRHPEYGLILIEKKQFTFDHLHRLGFCEKDAKALGK